MLSDPDADTAIRRGIVAMSTADERTVRRFYEEMDNGRRNELAAA